MLSIPPWVFAAGMAGAVIMVYLVFRVLFPQRESSIDRRLNDHDGGDSGVLVGSHTDVLFRRIRPEEESGMRRIDAGFDRMVARTGLDVSPSEILGLTALFGVLLFAGLYLWRDQLWLAALGFLLGIGIPLVAMWFLQRRHQNNLQQQLPDALYLLARSLRAGLSLEQAMELIGEQGTKPLANEFQLVNRQVRLGLTIPIALQGMASRVNLLDMNSFVSIVTYYQGAGGNLPLLLDRLAASARDRNQFRGQFLAVTAQARVTAIAIAIIPFVLLLVYAVFDMEHVRTFFHSFNGWLLLGLCLLLQIIGGIWMYRLLRSPY